MDRETRALQRIEIERCVLGWYIIQPELLAEHPPEAAHFTSEGQAVLGCIRRAGENGGIGAASVWHELEAKGLDRLLPLHVYETQLLYPPQPRPESVQGYLAWLAARAAEDELETLAGQILGATQDPQTPPHVLDQLIEEFQEARRHPHRQVLDCADLTTILEEPDQEPPWVIPGWLSQGDICIIGGEPGSGKSMLALDLALALGQGRPFLGMTTQQQRVLYVDEEQPRQLARRRLQMFLRHDQADPANLQLKYLYENGLNLDNKTHLDLLTRTTQDFNPDWIILDSLIRFHRRDENSNTDMSAFYTEVLKPLALQNRAGLVILHHLAKPSKDRPGLSHRLRGASDIRAMVDQAWALEGDPSGRTRSLTHNKCRWDMTQPSLDLSYQEDNGRAWLAAEQTRNVVRETILSALELARDEGLPRMALVQRLRAQGYTRQAADNQLKREFGRLRAEGLAYSDERKGKAGATYWLAEFSPQRDLEAGG